MAAPLASRETLGSLDTPRLTPRQMQTEPSVDAPVPVERLSQRNPSVYDSDDDSSIDVKPMQVEHALRIICFGAILVIVGFLLVIIPVVIVPNPMEVHPKFITAGIVIISLGIVIVLIYLIWHSRRSKRKSKEIKKRNDLFDTQRNRYSLPKSPQSPRNTVIQMTPTAMPQNQYDRNTSYPRTLNHQNYTSGVVENAVILQQNSISHTNPYRSQGYLNAAYHNSASLPRSLMRPTKQRSNGSYKPYMFTREIIANPHANHNGGIDTLDTRHQTPQVPPIGRRRRRSSSDDGGFNAYYSKRQGRKLFTVEEENALKLTPKQMESWRLNRFYENTYDREQEHRDSVAATIGSSSSYDSEPWRESHPNFGRKISLTDSELANRAGSDMNSVSSKQSKPRTKPTTHTSYVDIYRSSQTTPPDAGNYQDYATLPTRTDSSDQEGAFYINIPYYHNRGYTISYSDDSPVAV